MLRLLAPSFSILLAAFFLMFGHGLQSVIIPVRAGIEEFSASSIGLLSSLMFAGLIAGGVFAPHLIVRAGHIRAFTAMVSVASAIALLHPLTLNIWVWMAARVVTGFCIAGIYLIIESWLNEQTSNENRGLVMSAYTIIVFGGIMLGQFALSGIPDIGFEAFVIASVFFSIAVVPVAMTTSAQPAPIAVVRLRPLQLYKTSPAAVVSIVFVGMALGTLMTMMPLLANMLGFPKQQAAYIAAAIMLGALIFQYPVGRISDYIDRRLVLIGAGVSSAVLCIGTGVILGNLNAWVIIGLMVVLGGMVSPLYSVAAAHAYDHADPENSVETAAGLQLLYGIGSTIGPYGISVAMQNFGPQAMFFSIAVIVALMSLHLLFRISVRTALVSEEKTDFDYASTAPVGGVITPDAYDEYDVEEEDYFLVPEDYEVSDIDAPYDGQEEASTTERVSPIELDDEGTPL